MWTGKCQPDQRTGTAEHSRTDVTTGGDVTLERSSRDEWMSSSSGGGHSDRQREESRTTAANRSHTPTHTDADGGVHVVKRLAVYSPR